MFEHAKKNGLLVIFLLLLLGVAYLFYLDFYPKKELLTFAVLDVGQGDAIFIVSPTGTQILIDSGPPGKILSALSRIMSPFDKSIDVLIATHPDQDHIGGMSDVLKTYKIGMFLEPGVATDSKTYQNLETEIKAKNITDVLARKGMHLDLGGGAALDILFPDRNVSDWETNSASIVSKLTYGNTSIMLTGDATLQTEKILLTDLPTSMLKSNILKIGHHGSRTSTSDSFVRAVAPQYGLISDGKDNKYGHPHQETLSTLDKYGVKVLRTDLLGTIVFSCDRILPCEIN